MGDIVWRPTPELLTASNVARFMARHGLPSFDALVRRSIDDPAWFWAAAAEFLGISQKTLRLAAESGEIDAVHPLPDGPWIFRCADLEGPAAQTIVDRARRGARHPTGPHPG